MADGSGIGSARDGSAATPGEVFDGIRKDIEKYLLIALGGLIVAVLLLSFGFRLIAGMIIIASAAAGLLVYRKSLILNRKIQDSLNSYASINEKKDDVITDFSHKIREPLNNLVLIADMLIESGMQKKQRELLDTFIASTNNMVTIVNELTMKSSGNFSYRQRKPLRFNLLSTIQNTIEIYNLKDRANIDFIINRKEFGDMECLGDPIILKQIFLDIFNTIENHGSDQLTKVTINLKKEKELADDNHLVLRIQTDRSIVLINEENREHGLAARLIYSAGGTFKQEVGNNSTVLTFIIPYICHVELKPRSTQHRTGDPEKKLQLNKEMKDLRILLVEDNLINQKITLLTLMPLVNVIDTAVNGKEAIEKFSQGAYDIILMDIRMPVMSGLDAAEKIREIESASGSHVPIIAITANAMIGDKEKCLSAGIDEYISKPYQPSVLINKIKNLL